MTTIQIAYEVPAGKLAAIESMLAETALRDVNWNGAEFEIERAEFTCIPDDDSAASVQLLGNIFRIIDGDE